MKKSCTSFNKGFVWGFFGSFHVFMQHPFMEHFWLLFCVKISNYCWMLSVFNNASSLTILSFFLSFFFWLSFFLETSLFETDFFKSPNFFGRLILLLLSPFFYFTKSSRFLFARTLRFVSENTLFFPILKKWQFFSIHYKLYFTEPFPLNFYNRLYIFFQTLIQTILNNWMQFYGFIH